MYIALLGIDQGRLASHGVSASHIFHARMVSVTACSRTDTASTRRTSLKTRVLTCEVSALVEYEKKRARSQVILYGEEYAEGIA
jgi:hypothetical protein